MASAAEEEVPAIQVLEKDRYFTQALVRLPSALPSLLPPLSGGPSSFSSSSVRIRTEAFSLSSNNFTYAKLGTLLGWWDAHPLPASAPAPYGDAARYGRTNCWGYARVLESTSPAAPRGSYLWGYLPVGTLAQDLEVRPSESKNDGSLVVVPGWVTVTNEYRQHLMPIYNQYRVYPAEKGLEIQRKDEGVAWDVLIGVMHTTAYLMNRYVFAPNPLEAVAPHPGDAPWTPEQAASLTDAIVISFAPGSKVGLAFAHLLRNERPAEARPRVVIGAASEHSRAFVERTGFYDEVVSSTGDDPVATLDRVLAAHPPTSSGGSKTKVAIFDFGGRGGAAARWAEALEPVLNKEGERNLLLVSIGSEIQEQSAAEMLAARTQAHGAGNSSIVRVLVNADDMRTRAIAREEGGEQAFYEGLDASWAAFKARGIPGFRIRWGEGMESAVQGWDELARGEVAADEGLVFKV
ncbi:hypothetical protein SLS62_004381 [Diatrype stigma]|uniref:Uncharacterized protein n=1 Tax=Diatrype stigma TaxID=117547 RepID=A0AAN9YQN7_9PEZI